MSPVSSTLRYAWSRRGLAVWVGALGIIVTVTTTAVLAHRDRTLERTRFGLLSNERITAIRTEIDRPINSLAMIAATGDEQWGNSDGDFGPLSNELFEQYPQVRALAYVQSRPDRSRSRTAAGGWEITTYSSRDSRGQQAELLDSLPTPNSDSTKRGSRFLCQSRSSEEFGLGSGQIPSTQRRVLVCQPVLESRPSDPSSGRADMGHSSPNPSGQTRGWLVMEVDLGVAMTLAMHRLSQVPIEIALFSQEPLLGQQDANVKLPAFLETGADSVQTQFEIAEHPWVLVASSKRGSLLGERNESPWLTMIVGLFASGALAVYVAAIVSRSARIEHLVEERTRQLQDANVLLKQENSYRRRAEERANEHANSLEQLNEDLLLIREDMAKTLVELEQRNQELDEFNFIASHDLQEPVRKLISFSKLLKQDLGDELGDDVRQDLHYIVDAAHRMKQLISDLLAFSKAGRTEMSSEPVDLNECVQVALDSIMLQIEERKASVLVQELPTIKGDIVLITQMLQNLISNAIKFCDEDAPSVSISAKVVDDEAVLCVQDNGIGISPGACDRVFQPFQRLHGRNKYEGNGIGLAICRKTVARHRGRIWVESEPGHGSRFFVALAKYDAVSKPTSKMNALPVTV